MKTLTKHIMRSQLTNEWIRWAWERKKNVGGLEGGLLVVNCWFLAVFTERHTAVEPLVRGNTS